MAVERSIGSGLSESVVESVTTVERPKRSRKKGSKTTGGGSKPKIPLSEVLMIVQSAFQLLADNTGPIVVHETEEVGLVIYLPASVRICHEPGCHRMYPDPADHSICCDLHQAGKNHAVTSSKEEIPNDLDRSDQGLSA